MVSNRDVEGGSGARTAVHLMERDEEEGRGLIKTATGTQGEENPPPKCSGFFAGFKPLYYLLRPWRKPFFARAASSLRRATS